MSYTDIQKMVMIFGEKVKVKNNTTKFKKWFKDSKIIDTKGNPLIVYHGTTKDFDTFDVKFAKSNGGFYFCTEKRLGSIASYYSRGKKPIECYLSIQNPKVIIAQESNTSEKKEEVINAKKEGYDGIISITKLSKKWQYFNYFNDSLEEEFLIPGDIMEIVAFYPNQIKSIYNKGTFSIESDNIYT